MASVSPFRFRVASVASAKIGYYLMKVMAELGSNEDADDEEDEKSHFPHACPSMVVMQALKADSFVVEVRYRVL